MASETRDQNEHSQGQGRLFVVATPIGNLADITLRAIETLKTVDAIAAEDTRISRKLLQRYGITTPMLTLHEHNEEHIADALLARLQHGENIALISDAGTPLISDPGFRLVKKLRQAGIVVTPIPGPSSIIAALCASGLPSDRFRFAGFLPRGGNSRREALALIAESNETTIILESPKRLVQTLKELAALLDQIRELCVARELTKIHEEFINGSAEALLAHFEAHPPRGEIVLLIAGKQEQTEEATDAQIIAALNAPAVKQLAPSARAKAVARKLGASKSRVYSLLLEQESRDG